MRRASSNNSANILDQIYSNNGTKKKTPRTARSLIPQRRKKPTPKSPRTLKTLKTPQSSKTPEIPDPVKVQTSPVVNGSSGVSKTLPSSHPKSPVHVFSVNASITEKEKNETDRMNDEREKSIDPVSEKSSESEDERDDYDMDEDISIENFFNEEPSSSDADTELPDEEHVQTITVSGSDDESGESRESVENRGSSDGENSEENDDIESMDVELPESNLRILSIKRGKQNISYCQALLDHYSKLAKNNHDESLLLMPTKVIKVMETLLCNDGVLSTISGIVETSERSVEKARRDFETNGKRNASDYIGKIPCSRHVQQLNWRVKSFYKYAKAIFSDNGVEKIPILFATSSVVNARINELMRDRDADSIKSLSESLGMDKDDLTSELITMNDRFCTAFDEGHELAKRFGIYKETRGRKRKQDDSKQQDKAKTFGLDNDQSGTVDIDSHDGKDGKDGKNGKNGKDGKTKRSKTNPVVVQIEAVPQTPRTRLEPHVNLSAGSELVRTTFEEANHGEVPSLGELTKSIYFTPYAHEHVLDLYHKHQNRARTYAEELSLIAPHDPEEDWELHTLFMKNKKSLIEGNPFAAAFRFPYMKDAFREVSKSDTYTFSLKNPFYAEMSIRFSEEGGLIFHCEQLRCDFHIPKEIVFIIQSLPVFKEMCFGQKFFSWFVIADESNSDLNGHIIPLGADFN